MIIILLCKLSCSYEKTIGDGSLQKSGLYLSINGDQHQVVPCSILVKDDPCE
jgi:hypothetical protein